MKHILKFIHTMKTMNLGGIWFVRRNLVELEWSIQLTKFRQAIWLHKEWIWPFLLKTDGIEIHSLFVNDKNTLIKQ